MNAVVSILLLIQAQDYKPQCKGMDLRQSKVDLKVDVVCRFDGILFTHDAVKCRNMELAWCYKRWKEDKTVERLKCKAERQLRQEILKESLECANERTVLKYRYKWYRTWWFVAAVTAAGASLVTGLAVYGAMK